MRMLPSPPDAAAFARFGTIIDGPLSLGDRRLFSDWLTPVGGLQLQFHTNGVAPTALPLALTQIERHPHAAQVFLPMDVSRYVVTVIPSSADGEPDLAGALCMALPGTLGVIYDAGVWHAGVTVLDRVSYFAVLMYRGAADDDDFRRIDPITILPTQSRARA